MLEEFYILFQCNRIHVFTLLYFSYLILQGQLLQTILKLFLLYIIGIKIKVHINNYYLKLTSNNINSATLDKFMFETLNRI